MTEFWNGEELHVISRHTQINVFTSLQLPMFIFMDNRNLKVGDIDSEGEKHNAKVLLNDDNTCVSSSASTL